MLTLRFPAPPHAVGQLLRLRQAENYIIRARCRRRWRFPAYRFHTDRRSMPI